jgi:hypothetical protein
MAKSISVNKKSKRGRPKKAGGVDPVSAVRFPAGVAAAIDKWGKEHGVGRSEAIRRLVELGLTVKPASASAARAKELAAKAIDERLPADTPPAEREIRKRMLLKRKP